MSHQFSCAGKSSRMCHFGSAGALLLPHTSSLLIRFVQRESERSLIVDALFAVSFFCLPVFASKFKIWTSFWSRRICATAKSVRVFAQSLTRNNRTTETQIRLRWAVYSICKIGATQMAALCLRCIAMQSQRAPAIDLAGGRPITCAPAVSHSARPNR